MIAEKNAFPEGSFLHALYEPLDPSLEPSLPYPAAPLDASLEPSLPYPGTDLHMSGHSVTVPTNPFSPKGKNLEIPVHSSGELLVSNQPLPHADFPVTNNLSIPEPAPSADEQAINNFESRGKKRKGDENEAAEAVAMVQKRRCSKDSENMNVETVNDQRDSLPGSEETAISGEMKERAGKPTLSGRVPLMPAHLAEGGYQGEKKGVRGRKPPTKKPRSKGYTGKPLSKGVAKIPGKKKGISRQ